LIAKSCNHAKIIHVGIKGGKMSTATKYKWIISLTLGGVLLVVAMIWGSGQTTYAADPGLNAVPVIDHIYPDRAKAGSGSTPMIIFGLNFGNSEDFIRIWLADPGHDYEIAPISVIDNGISLVIPDTLLVNPITYTLRVVKSNGLSVPTIPPNLVYDQASNIVDFLVYAPRYLYLPMVNK
jgi:hypothetical protein